MWQEVVPVLVSYHTPRWIRVAIRSYHEHFPGDPILVVDNNPAEGRPGWDEDCERERRWLSRQPDVVVVPNEQTDKRHGIGLDLAVDYCRRRHAPYLLHFEPDCLIWGAEWYESLWRAMNGGAWMAGSETKMYGPIHPCPSMWRVETIQHSFADQPRRGDVDHPRFGELFDMNWLQEAVARESPHMAPFWRENWDTAQKNWFEAAVRDRAALVPPPGDFRHFWCGSSINRWHPLFEKDPRVRPWLADPWEAPVRTAAVRGE